MNFLPSDSEQERCQKGWLHEQEMVAKYGKIHGMENARNFHLWWTKKQYEQGGYEYDVRESPAPYSNLYPDHFIQTFFSRGSESNLLYYLTNDFIGDEIDSEYIKSILITAKDYGLFTPEALVIFTGGSVITYDPPASGGKYIDVVSAHNVSSSDVLVGSESNKDKAKAIRRWLKRRAKELKVVSVSIDGRLTTELLAEYHRFFRPYASQLTPAHIPAVFAQWLANGEDKEPFRANDLLIKRLENIYNDTAEPEQFLTCLKKLLEVVCPLLENDKTALDLFPSENPSVYVDDDNTSGRPVYGNKSENKLRAQHAYRRLERWIKLKQKSSLSQLLAYLTTLPVVLRPVVSEDPHQGLKSEVCLPVYEHKDTKLILDQLLPDVRETLLTMSTEAIQQALLAPLAPLANFSLDSFIYIESRGKQRNGKNEVERLPEYYPAPYFEWEELKSSKHLLNWATVSPHFWMALSFSLTMRHHFAKMLHELYAPTASAQEKQANEYIEALLHIPVIAGIIGETICYTIPDELIDYDDFVAKLLPKRRKFEQVLSTLKKKHLRHLRHRLTLLVNIDRDRIKEKRAAYERGDYSLNMLPADFPALHFDLLNEKLHYPQIGPLFWSGFYSLVQYGQLLAIDAIDAIDSRFRKQSVSHFAETSGFQKTSILDPAYVTLAGSDVSNALSMVQTSINTPLSLINQDIASIDDLCLPPFTPVELNELLTHLKVIQNGKWHLGKLSPRKAAPKSAFPAVYRVLSSKQNKLMKEVSDIVWADLFRREFNVPLSERTANYKEGMPDYRPEFNNYLADAQTWVKSWKERSASA